MSASSATSPVLPADLLKALNELWRNGNPKNHRRTFEIDTKHEGCLINGGFMSKQNQKEQEALKQVQALIDTVSSSKATPAFGLVDRSLREGSHKPFAAQHFFANVSGVAGRTLLQHRHSQK